MRVGSRFFPTWDKWQPEMGTVGEGFFCFCKKDNNGNLGWGTAVVALTWDMNYWSCSNK
jgi:hypothetical protein